MTTKLKTLSQKYPHLKQLEDEEVDRMVMAYWGWVYEKAQRGHANTKPAMRKIAELCHISSERFEEFRILCGGEAGLRRLLKNRAVSIHHDRPAVLNRKFLNAIDKSLLEGDLPALDIISKAYKQFRQCILLPKPPSTTPDNIGEEGNVLSFKLPENIDLNDDDETSEE